MHALKAIALAATVGLSPVVSMAAVWEMVDDFSSDTRSADWSLRSGSWLSGGFSSNPSRLNTSSTGTAAFVYKSPVELQGQTYDPYELSNYAVRTRLASVGWTATDPRQFGVLLHGSKAAATATEGYLLVVESGPDEETTDIRLRILKNGTSVALGTDVVEGTMDTRGTGQNMVFGSRTLSGGDIELFGAFYLAGAVTPSLEISWIDDGTIGGSAITKGSFGGYAVGYGQFYSFEIIPEPTTLALLAMGSALMLGRRRRHAASA